MAKIIDGGSAKRDDPIYSSGAMVHFKPKLPPSTKSSQHRQTRNVGGEALVYRQIHDGSYVIAEKSRAEFVDRINRALRESQTWGEFRKAMPADEYSQLIRRTFDDQGEDRPRSGDSFTGVAGQDEGDYPPWLQSEMQYLIPDDILDQFFERFSTFLNGNCVRLTELNLHPVLAELRRRGRTVIEASDLNFH